MKVLAFHLPQFHPIPENDKWWGAGFTEWRNVAKARPLFRGHRQPIIPGELGFYDLRLRETQAEQADLARAAGISGFCYYHYWYEGRLLLERPLELLLQRPEIDFPFCLCWANHSWTAHWAGRSDEVLVEQRYPGIEDHRKHYIYLRKFFADSRYFRVNGAPILVLHFPQHIPELRMFVDSLKKWATEDGFSGIHLVASSSSEDLFASGVDSIAPHTLNFALARTLVGVRKLVNFASHRFLKFPKCTISYDLFAEAASSLKCDGRRTIPVAIPNWDNTPRVGRRGTVLVGSTPEKFSRHLESMTRNVERDSESLMLIKSWNEWAEGNYLEPDLQFGRGWMHAVSGFVGRFGQSSSNMCR